MTEYTVSLESTTTVQAESREEAEEKAMEKPRDTEVVNATARELDPEKDFFYSHIREVGSTQTSVGYDLIKDKSALRVLFSSTTSMARRLAPPNAAPQMRYNLAAYLLATVEGIDWDTLQGYVGSIDDKAKQLSENVDDDPFGLIAGTDFVPESRQDEINQEYTLEVDEE